MTRLAFVDTETTGLDPDRHQIWEVGLIIRDQAVASGAEHAEREPNEPLGVIDTEYEWQLPVDLGRADMVGLKIGRFYDRREDDERLTPLATFARRFSDLTMGAHLVGAVPSFDEERLRDLLRSNGACPGWHYHLVDVENLAVGFIAGICRAGGATFAESSTGEVLHDGRRWSWLTGAPEPPWSSEDLSRAIGLDPDTFERHTALGDARWARAIYDTVMGTTPAAHEDPF